MPVAPEALQALYQARFEESRYDEAVDVVMREVGNHVRFRRYVPLAEMGWRVSSRVKDLETIIEKVDRGRRRPRTVESLAELESIVTDIAGVRVVLDRLDQVKETGRFIEGNASWQVVGAERKRRGDTGYRSLHIDVMLNTTHYSDVRCEIQCRTLLEHAFAIWTTRMYEYHRANPESVPDNLLGRMSEISHSLHQLDKRVNELAHQFGRVMVRRAAQ